MSLKLPSNPVHIESWVLKVLTLYIATPFLD